MKFLRVEQINEHFGTDYKGSEIGYGEKGLEFREVECSNIDDFHENAELGQCWTDEQGVTFYKIKNDHNEAEAFFIKDGEIETI